MMGKIATIQNITTERPGFPLGEICGKYEFLPKNEERLAEGGLRTKGQYKKNTSDRPLVTYITVVRNNKKTIKRCMESVWNQTYDNIEYIIIDGASTDGTIEIIEGNNNLIDYFVSEPDHGIYDAMNRALMVASGEIINILNSDDFAEINAAKEAVKMYKEAPYDLLVGSGNVYNINGNLAFRWLPREIKTGTIFFGVPMLHQAVYATRRCYEVAGPYDYNYKIGADFKWFMNVFNNNLTIFRTDLTFANFMLGGMSADKSQDLKERVSLIRDYFPFLSEEDASILYKNLDVTVFYENVSSPKSKNEIDIILEKYQNEPKLLKAISEALKMQYEELKNVYNLKVNLNVGNKIKNKFKLTLIDLLKRIHR